MAKRRSMSVDEVRDQSGAIRELFFEHFDLSGVRYLHCFLSIANFNEIDTTPIFERLWREFPEVKTVVPRISSGGDGMLESVVYAADTPLFENSWGIFEPAHDELVLPTEIDIVLVPLLCFDCRGHRLGYGKGFYDRFLAECRPDCRKVGLSFFPPVDIIDDAGGHDVTLDMYITPDRIYTFD